MGFRSQGSLVGRRFILLKKNKVIILVFHVLHKGIRRHCSAVATCL